VATCLFPQGVHDMVACTENPYKFSLAYERLRLEKVHLGIVGNTSERLIESRSGIAEGAFSILVAGEGGEQIDLGQQRDALMDVGVV
jgi:hypothetical protein